MPKRDAIHVWVVNVLKYAVPVLQRLKKGAVVLMETKLATSTAVSLTALFLLVVWFTQTTFSLPPPASQGTGIWKAAAPLGISNTLTILRILQSILTTSTTFVLLSSFDMVGWILLGRDQGIETLLVLGLSSSTAIWGLLGLLCDKHIIFRVRGAVLTKLTILFAAWASGVLLFARTHVSIVYRPVSRYNVTGGVGSFQAPYVAEYLDNLQELNQGYNAVVLPYSILVTASKLVTNPAYASSTAPVTQCDDETLCNSYLIPGGLLLLDPWPALEHAEYPTITIFDAPAIQIDFVRIVDEEETFVDARDCLVYGSQTFIFGMQFCLVASERQPGSLLAGIFICENGVQDGKCQTDVDPPKIITRMTIYQRHATTTSARANLSILAVQDLSPPIQETSLNVSALKQSFSWLFNASAADIPLTSSPAQFFWTSQKQLTSPFWRADVNRVFHSLLAFPFWHFQDNNYGNVRLDPQQITTSLPDEFKTYAEIDQPMNRISVDRGMFIAFCVLESVCLILIWAALVSRWTHHSDMVEISSYPLIDFAMKTQQREKLRGESTIAQPDANEEGPGIIELKSGDKFIRRCLQAESTALRQGLITSLGDDIEMMSTEAASQNESLLQAQSQIGDDDVGAVVEQPVDPIAPQPNHDQTA